MKKMIYAMVAGFTLGILLAPSSGSKTRKKIRRRYQKLTERLTGHETQMYERAKALAGDEINQPVVVPGASMG